MRFTERYDDIFATTKDGKETHEKGVRIKDKVGGFEKLAKLEDIEEELGIDLVTLFKALKNGIYIKELGNNYPYWSFELRNTNGIGIVIWWGYFSTLFLKDYGKTWALTKEELENE